MNKEQSDKINYLNQFITEKENLKRKHPLRYLFWESTLRCNLDCLHCGSDCLKNNSSFKNEISTNLIKRELKNISNKFPSDSITFAVIGGEPLLREDIFSVGAYAADLGFNWGITTNGMLLNKKNIIQLKQAKLKTISVSIDGIEEDHNKLRNNPNAYKTVTKAVKNLLSDKFYKTMDVICCVNKLNINKLDIFIDNLIEIGVPRVRFTPVFSHGRASLNRNLLLNGKDKLKMLSFIADKRISQNNIEITLSEEGYWGADWECRIRDGFHYCGSGILIGSILHDGKVIGCPSVSRKYVEGDIFTSTFVDLWENKFNGYRQNKIRYFPKKCHDCDHWILCEGGGFHLLDQKHMEFDFCQLESIFERRNSCH